MSLRSRSHVKASVVLTRADQLFIHDYIRSLLNIILIYILISRRDLYPQNNNYLCNSTLKYLSKLYYIHFKIVIYIDDSVQDYN